MASVTLSFPDDLASQIRVQGDHLPEILALGLRELNAEAQSGFEGAADVFEFLAALPTAEETLKLRPSPRLAARVSQLLEKNRAAALTTAQEQEREKYEYLEHLVRMAKASARLKLESISGTS